MRESPMKIHRIIQLFFLISVLGTTNSMAEDSSVNTETYGIVDAVYPEESRIIIDDTSVLYNHESSFFKANGDSFYDKKSALPTGTPVIYQVIKKPPYLIIHGLKIISMQEYKNSQSNDDR